MNDPIRSLVQIDMMRLDEHWAYQTKLYHKWARQVPKAKEKVSLAEAAEKLAEAEMSKRVRDAPEKFGIEKVTEPAIKAAVLASKAVRRATRKRIRLQRVVDDLEVAVRTADMKKRSLEKLVDLEARDYFSSPRAPKNVPLDMKRSLEQSKKKALRRRGDDD